VSSASSPAHEQIRNLLGRYCHLLDAGDFTGLGLLFADAVLTDDRGRVAAKGAESATALWAGTVRRYDDGTPRTRHTTTNAVIEVHEDGTARCESSFVVFQHLGNRVEPIATGRYHDTFSCQDGTWRFSSRQFHLDHVGDVSHHMTGV
jgi:3-phenylpropionate/cinnamic acid dioxygenase small subunit